MFDKKNRYHCLNPKCGITFDQPKILNVCPSCLVEVKEDTKAGCQYWFGYLGERESCDGMPEECVECEKSIECMLRKEEYSAKAVDEIKKWWR